MQTKMKQQKMDKHVHATTKPKPNIAVENGDEKEQQQQTSSTFTDIDDDHHTASKPLANIPQRLDTKKEEPITLKPPIQTFASNHNKYDMIIGITTTPRKKNDGEHLDYLYRTLQSLQVQLNGTSTKKVLVYVQNNHGADHKIFVQAKQEMQANPNFFFFDNGKRFEDPFVDIPGHDYNGFWNMRPAHLARQQNCDVGMVIIYSCYNNKKLVSMTEHVMRNFEFDYFMFLEDDFLACDQMMPDIERALQFVEKRRDMCGLRVSYGMAGVILNRDRLRTFVDMVEDNIDAYVCVYVCFDMLAYRLIC